MKRVGLLAIIVCVISYVLANSVQAQSYYVPNPNDRWYQYEQHDPVIIAEGQRLQALSDKADEYAKNGDWTNAEKLYNEVYTSKYPSTHVIEALAHHAYLIADDDSAIKLYRQCIYDGTRKYNSYSRSTMELAIILSKRGNMDEAIRLYQASYHSFGDTWGDSNSPVILPNYSSTNQPYSINEFQATAHVLASMSCMPDDPSGETHLKAATVLDPTSPIGYFYLGKYYKEVGGHDADAVDALHKAWENGDSDVEKHVFEIYKGYASPEFKKAFDARFSDIPH